MPRALVGLINGETARKCLTVEKEVRGPKELGLELDLRTALSPPQVFSEWKTLLLQSRSQGSRSLDGSPSTESPTSQEMEGVEKVIAYLSIVEVSGQSGTYPRLCRSSSFSLVFMVFFGQFSLMPRQLVLTVS